MVALISQIEKAVKLGWPRVVFKFSRLVIAEASDKVIWL
jgi:hypothetical protein